MTDRIVTAKEFVSRLVPSERRWLALQLNYLADHEHELRLADGRSMSEGLDFADFLREAAVACIAEKTERPGYNVEFCPDCGHVHVDDNECSFPIGAGRICRCERAVPA